MTLAQADVELDGRHITARALVAGQVGGVFQAVGVALPPNMRERVVQAGIGEKCRVNVRRGGHNVLIQKIFQTYGSGRAMESYYQLRQQSGNFHMILARPTNLATYAEELASSGQTVFTRRDAMEALGLGHGAFLDAAARLAKRGHILAPRRGFYVITPTRFLKWGAPPPNWYVDAMMKDAGRPYYVALLKAAELHGAAHQAVMEFQVIADRQWKPIRAGRSKIVFCFRKDIGAVEAGIERRKTDTGSMRISSPALTALDLLRYRQASGGLDHAAGVLNELATQIDPEQLAVLAPAFERSVVQRLGYVLDYLGSTALAAPLRRRFLENGDVPWVELHPGDASNEIVDNEPQRDKRWRVIVRRSIEIDAQ